MFSMDERPKVKYLSGYLLTEVWLSQRLYFPASGAGGKPIYFNGRLQQGDWTAVEDAHFRGKGAFRRACTSGQGQVGHYFQQLFQLTVMLKQIYSRDGGLQEQKGE